VFGYADPKLAQAHHLMWEVREGCLDPVMEAELLEAMEHVQIARRRLAAIREEAASVDR
jgi:hypothetical protein